MKIQNTSLLFALSALIISIPVNATRQIAKLATQSAVKINPSGGFAGSGGSGVLIEKEGDLYSVLTNHHVVCSAGTYSKSACRKTFDIETYDGKIFPVLVELTETLQNQKNAPDLAIVKFKSSGNYKVAEIGNSESIVPGDQVYLYGFPRIDGEFSEKRTGEFLPGNISSIKGQELRYTIPTWWGTSGSPVFDVKGKVIAIHEKADTRYDSITLKQERTGINVGIPINTFKSSWEALKRTSKQPPTPIVADKPQRNIQPILVSPPTQMSNPLQTSKLKLIEPDKPLNSKPLVVQASESEGFYKQGLIDYDNNDYQSAITNLSKALKLNPSYFDALTIRGLAYNEQQSYKSALQDFNQALKQKPDSAITYYYRGITFSKLEDLQKAVDDFNKVISLDSNFEDAFFERAIITDSKDDIDKSLDILSEKIKSNPNDGNGFYKRGYIKFNLINKIDISEVNDFYALINKGSDVFVSPSLLQGAYDDFSEATKLDPSLALAYIYRSKLHYKILMSKFSRNYSGNLISNLISVAVYTAAQQQAIQWELEDLEKALSIYNQELSSSQDPKKFLERGILHSYMGKYPESISDLTRAIELRPQNILGYIYRNQSYVRLGNTSLAIADLDRAIEINPVNHQAFILRGKLFFRNGDYQKAISDYESATKINSKSLISYLENGYALLSLKQYEKAVEKFKKSIAIFPTRRGFNGLGNAYESLGDIRNAVFYYEKAGIEGEEKAKKLSN
jgi:tetratricopeptide (TPR) repeat protein